MTTSTLPAANDSAHRPPGVKGPAQLRQRIRAEFLEMPGLTLTLPQAARLWGLTEPQVEAAFADLIADGFLSVDPRGSYRRGGCPRCS